MMAASMHKTRRLGKGVMVRPRWQIDEIGRGRVRGWAFDPADHTERPILDVFLDGRFAGQVLANQNRVDLRAAAIGDGYHGFEWRHPALTGPDAARRVALEWPRLGFWGHRAPAAVGTLNLRHFRSPEAYLEARLAALADAAPTHEMPAVAQASAVPQRLLQPSAPDVPLATGGRTISAYQSYVLHRFRMESEFDPDLTEGEYCRFLRWYIQHYGSVRANLRIPLSKSDLDFLNAPLGGGAGRIRAMAIFAEDFAVRPLREEADWAFFNAASLGISDCLHFAGASSDELRLEMFARQHPILQALDLQNGQARSHISRMLASIAPREGMAAGSRLESAILRCSNPKMVEIQMIGPFSKALGVGESCRRMARALAETGFTVRTCDFSIDYPNEAITELSVRLEEPGPARVNILHVNLEEIPKVAAYWPDVFTGATNIAVPYLELSHPAPEQELGLALVDRVFAATEHIRSVIGDRLPVDVVGSAVELSDLPDRPAARRASLGSACGPDEFVVLVSGDALSGLDRKNLSGAVRAFLMAFPTDARCRLVIKTHSIGRTHDARQRRIWNDLQELAVADPRVILFDKHLDASAYQSLKAACDVYLSLHRAEGLGYHVLECMQLGIPCIVTDYSGTKDFSGPGTALPVGFRMRPVRPWEYPFTRGEQLWAEPSIEDAAAKLKMLAANREMRSAIGRRARQHIHEHFAIPAFGARLKALLAPLLIAKASA